MRAGVAPALCSAFAGRKIEAAEIQAVTWTTCFEAETTVAAIPWAQAHVGEGPGHRGCTRASENRLRWLRKLRLLLSRDVTRQQAGWCTRTEHATAMLLVERSAELAGEGEADIGRRTAADSCIGGAAAQGRRAARLIRITIKRMTGTERL